MKMQPVIFVWSDDETMVPVSRFKALCARQFVVGEEYALQIVEARSMASHNHYFAALTEMWNNLPEQYDGRWPTVEHLRAWALVETGFCTERDHVCDSPAKAKHLAKIIRVHSDYSIIRTSGNVVKVFEPKSQSIMAMGGTDSWKASKDAVLNLVATLNPGLGRREVEKEAAKVVPPERTKPEPSAAAAQMPAAQQPTTAPAYFAYARAWINGAKNAEQALARWESERTLRDDLRVSIPNRSQLEAMIAKIPAPEETGT